MEKSPTELLQNPDRQVKPGRNAAQTKERILRNAERLFNRYPYEMVTLREIAALSEINVALIGRYFGSKKELFCAVLDSIDARMRPFRPNDRLGDLADRLIRTLRNEHEDDSQLSILNILMLSSQSREAMPVIQERVKAFFNGVAEEAGAASVPVGFMLASCSLGVLMLRGLLPQDYPLSVSRIDIRKVLQLMEHTFEKGGRC